MAFQINNPTLKNIIDFLKNQLGSMSTINDAPTDSKKYGRKNGFWVEITEGGGGGGGSTNIGDNVYTEGNQLIIQSSSTQIEDFFKNIAPEFDNTVSHPINSLVLYENQLYTLTAAHTAPTAWANTSHTTAVLSDLLNLKAPINSPTLTGTPKLYSTPSENDNSEKIATTKYVDTAVNKREILKIAIDNFSSLPKSISGTNTIAGSVESDMVPIAMDLSNPAAQIGTWTITTGNASISITGTNAISGTTNATIYLMKTR